MDAQLKKGVLELCLLQCLSGEPQYGYDIIQMMHKYFPEVTESTFYAILRRLHREGAATTYISEESRGPVRKYYQITEQGRKEFERMRKDWVQLKEIVEKIGI